MSKARIYAITDIGSNTVKCAFYEVHGEGDIRDIDFVTEKLGLIARVKDGALPNDAISLLCDTVARYKAKAEELGAYLFKAFGTAVMRKINNFAAVEHALYERCGIHIHLISGDEEARLSFEGTRMLHPELDHGIMADMGGASTELIAFEKDDIRAMHSFSFGCLALYKALVKDRFPTSQEADNIRRFVSDELKKYDFTASHDKLVLIGGTGKAIGKLLSRLGYSQDVNPTGVLYELASRFAAPADEDIAILEKYVPTRVETVMPGLIAYTAIAERAGAESVVISGGGIRDGYLKKLITEDF